MSLRRFAACFGIEFGQTFRRPLFIVFAIMLALTAWGLSSGHMQISSGDTSVGGMKAWITSEFAQTQTMAFLTLLYYAFFVAAAAGLTLLRDRETRVDALLHSTPLRPGEYVWGRFLAVIAAFSLLLLWQAAMAALFNHVIPNAEATEIRGPFAPWNYAKPLLTFGLPFVVFFAGVSMWIGEKSRSPVLVFVAPVATLLVCGFFLWSWSPAWLDVRVDRLLQVIDPSGYRWLEATHLKVDRGVRFYNTHVVPYDGRFWLNRAWLVVIGLGAAWLAQRAVAASMRGAVARPARRGTQAAAAGAAPGLESLAGASHPPLAMLTRPPGFVASTLAIARAEGRELLSHAGLYLFVPLILIQALGNALLAVGPFDTPLLLTPGITAVQVAQQVSVLVLLLLLFYTVESLEREKTTGVQPLLHATPVRTGAMLAGKAVANSLIGAVILLAALAGCGIAIVIQQTVPFSLAPYALTWGLLLVPTFVAWCAFVTAAYALTHSRYGAYAISLAVLAFTAFRALTNQIHWAGNWPLWGALRWSDLSFYETDRVALVLNRVMVLGFAALFTVLGVRLFRRRDRDPVRVLHALAPARAFRSALGIAPWAVVPVVACIALMAMVGQGIEGGAREKADKDYWAKNLKTWLGARLPDIARADVALELDPDTHGIVSAGTFTLVNPHDSTLATIPLTGGHHWGELEWTLNGKPYEPVDSKRLYLFTPPEPLARGDSVTIGWSFRGRFPDGITRNGGNTEEFVLPSGVVLTGFTPSFVPVVGFMESVGETDKNRTEPRQYARDYWRGITRAGFGATAWFPARVAITGPAEYTWNSVGVCVRDSVHGALRTQVWETDAPVKILNVVAGRWQKREGQGTTIYYSERHPYNVDEMSATLDAARRWYSQWFLPYPWRELKLSEFPALAGYAQGFGTNITFSENIGFLTRNTDERDATFLVTAHEAAHQWWGNILTPADGPGGDFLSEGMAHYSTLLLFEQERGPRARMEFAKGIEARYGDRRRVDEERPMYDVDGRRRSDATIIYDRGGWVFWMLHDFLGDERALAGYRNFIRTWSQGPDHPALQDFVAGMRPFAVDPGAYDAFTRQWFEDKVMPEYRVSDVAPARDGQGWNVRVTIENIGTGTMPVEIAATTGERWAKPDQASPTTASADGGAGVVAIAKHGLSQPNLSAASGAVATAGGDRAGARAAAAGHALAADGNPAEARARTTGAFPSIVNPSYREARATVTLGAGEKRTVTIACAFVPKEIVVDPDVRVLQLNRKLAVANVNLPGTGRAGL